MSHRDNATRKDVLSLFGENGALRRRLHQRLSHRELQRAIMLGTQHMVGDWFRFISLMDRVVTVLNETTAETQALLADLSDETMKHPYTMTIDEALTILKALDMTSEARFTDQEREAITNLGAAGWAGDLEPTDPRIQELPEAIREHVVELVKIMQTKRVVQ